ncbi:MAG TPA: single-stranded DNA-binding protein [Candidatus Obscuribacterales bacterium]
MSMSKIVVSGRIIRGPEKRFTPNNNIAVTEFAIAVESQNRDGTTESNPVKVITWRDLAERCAQELKKGDLVAVDGRLQMNSYTTSDGQRRREAEIDAIAVENLSKTLAGGPASEPVDRPVARVAARGEASGQEDLEAIFASDDEIPF